MQCKRIGVAVAAWTALVACGGGGGSGRSSAGGTALSSSTLHVVAQSPMEGAVQVPLSTDIRIDVDGAVVPASLTNPGTGLEDAAGNPVAGTTTLDNGGTTILFTPSAPLAPQTNYVFRLSPLTCDGGGRILDDELVIHFRSFDDVPPSVVGCSVTAMQGSVPRTVPLTVDCDEPLLASTVGTRTVQVLDDQARPWPVTVQCSGARISITPTADLPGNAAMTLQVEGGSLGVQDAGGNALASTWTRPFVTTLDRTPPTVTGLWPQGLSSVSPLAQPELDFDESIDPDSLAGGAIVLTDEFTAPVPFDVTTSADQRTVRVAPRAALVTGRTYYLVCVDGSHALTDVSGNPLPSPVTLSFGVGSDVTPPALQKVTPATGSSRVSLLTRPEVMFDEALDPASIRSGSMTLTAGATVVPATMTLINSDTTLCLQPLAPLQPSTDYTLQVVGGAGGVRDEAGNPIVPVITTFRTTDDATGPTVLLEPANGSASVPVSAATSAVFDTPIDPASINPATVLVRDDFGRPVPGDLTVSRANRVVHFTPYSSWSPGVYYTMTVRGGPTGVHEPSGNGLAADVSTRFRAGNAADTIAPTVSVTLDDTADPRKDDIMVPPSGFTIDVTAFDPVHYSLDMSTADVVISGAGPVPGPSAIFATATLDGSHLHWLAPPSQALPNGDYSVVARVRDLSGNLGTSPPLSFHVGTPDNGTVPFERTQVVWVRFDMDRDHNGRGDFEDDLVRLGLATDGDPAGTNARMVQIVRDGVLTEAHALFGRAPDGSPLPGAIALRLTPTHPAGLLHSEIACGGLDPEGRNSRVLGDSSTGTLGRAFFDRKNQDMGDRNIGTSPGLGVFPGELFLFESSIHLQVYPSFQTTWARRFLPLVPGLGGTPVGMHAEDPTVLSPSFDYASATASQRARYDTIFSAADDWSTAIGIILAHEIGHATGLVAAGPCPKGLHGDSSLHNEFATSSDVMAAAVGYDALVALSYAFRDLNHAYFRHQLLLR